MKQSGEKNQKRANVFFVSFQKVAIVTLTGVHFKPKALSGQGLRMQPQNFSKVPCFKPSVFDAKLSGGVLFQ